MPDRDYTKLRERIAIVNECLADGSGLGVAAQRCGITTPGLSRYLDAAGYMDLRKEVGAVTRIATALPYEEHLRRVRAVVEEGSQAGACRRLGLQPSTLSRWLKASGYGPDFEADLEDLLDEDGLACFPDLDDLPDLDDPDDLG